MSITRTLDEIRAGSRIFEVKVGNDETLGRYDEVRGFEPSAAHTYLGAVPAPPGGSRRSRWIAVRRVISRRLADYRRQTCPPNGEDIPAAPRVERPA